MAYRKMYDSVTVGNLPINSDGLYAGYVGGNWPTLVPIMQRFPHARVVSIAVNASQSAQVLDVETGDATANEVPDWLNRMRAQGRKNITIYTSRSNIDAVLSACDAAKVARPLIWAADWTGAPHTVAGAVAVQYLSNDYFDETCITDAFWPDSRPKHVVTRIAKKVVRKVVKTAKAPVHVIAKKKAPTPVKVVKVAKPVAKKAPATKKA